MSDLDSEVLLTDLIQEVPGVLQAPEKDACISGIALDSRLVKPGSLFVAVRGDNTDGHRYIPDAIQAGAVAVVGMLSITGLDVPYVQVAESRLALAYLAAAFYGFPARRLTMLGVTGTDGKTTTANLIFRILQTAGWRVGMISTVNAVIGEKILDTGFHVTTPEAPDVQRYLAEMVDAGLTHVILETTSHGWSQHRVAACDFDIGVVTNITHEHLDYHGSYEAYRDAKARLFTGLAQTPLKPFNPPRGAVLNRDDASYDYLDGVTSVQKVSYGLDPRADVRAQGIAQTAGGLAFTASGKDFEFEVSTSLVGEFNVSNCLAAISATLSLLGLPFQTVQQGISALPGVPGRFERIDLGQPFTVIVDFAHTPNALRRALEASRAILSNQTGVRGRVIAVFGSAGLRDRAKRRLMAQVSAQLADITVLTAEDPRTESLDAILAEMASGIESQGGVEETSFWRVPDRGEAMRFALRLAQPGDLVIACGKGHEQSMCFGATEYPWDDRIAMCAALAELLGKPGPEMPYLPTQKN